MKTKVPRSGWHKLLKKYDKKENDIVNGAPLVIRTSDGDEVFGINGGLGERLVPLANAVRDSARAMDEMQSALGRLSMPAIAHTDNNITISHEGAFYSGELISIERPTIDVTSLDSPGGHREFMWGGETIVRARFTGPRTERALYSMFADNNPLEVKITSNGIYSGEYYIRDMNVDTHTHGLKVVTIEVDFMLSSSRLTREEE